MISISRPGVIKCILSYNTPGKASYLATFFYQLGGCLSVGGVPSLIVGGVVLRSDALARALIMSPNLIEVLFSHH